MSKIKNAFNKVKAFAKEHKEEIVGIAVCIGAGVGFIAGATYLVNHLPRRSSEGKSIIEELPIPNWDTTHYDVEDYWADNAFDRTMIVNVSPHVMGEFGEKIINDLGHNPDLMVSLVMGIFEG